MTKETQKNEARYKLLYVDQQTVLELIRGLYTKHDFIALPDFSKVIPLGARVEAVQYDFSRLAFAFRLYHPDFDTVPDCQEIPALARSAVIRAPVQVFRIKHEGGIPTLEVQSGQPGGELDAAQD
ncbi:MAG: hypothetical protein ACYTEQ_05740 [Planctomycetota bacterium]|jgi:hypothetical protein